MLRSQTISKTEGKKENKKTVENLESPSFIRSKPMAGGGSRNKRIKKENVSQFVSITGVENETARYYLKV